MFLKIKISLCLILTAMNSFAQKDTAKQAFYYPDGKISSEGEMLNGKPVGYWRAYYPWGVLKSEGSREQYLLEGSWKFYGETGDLKKEIQYKHGLKEGVVKIYDDSCVLIREESYMRDTLHGVNKENFSKGGALHLAVPFKKGVKDGIAYELSREGMIITLTTFKHGFIKKKEEINRKNVKGKQGSWREFYPDSSLYKDMRYKNNVLNGYYKEYDRNGTLIVALLYIDGIIQENPEELTSLKIRREYHDNGQIKWEGTYNYLGEEEGTFKSFNEKGELIEAKVYTKGELLARGKIDKAGKRIGAWEFYYSGGKLRAKGDYNEGQRIGNWIFYHVNGKTEQKGKYVKGENPHGDWIWYYSNGEVLRTESFWKGKEDGLAIEYSDTATIISKGEYIDGKKDGIWFYEMADHKEQGSYIEGNKEGEWIYSYPNGKPNFKGAFIGGDPNGRHIYYYPNGRIKREEYYELGYQEGTWRMYDELGNLKLKTEWLGGQEVKIENKKVK